jgi:cobalt-zinc-cadmium efflux system membrane fusion protein
MTGNNTVSISRGAAIATALGLVVLGAVGTFGWIRVRGGDVSPRPKTEAAVMPGHDAPTAPSSTPAGTPQDVVLRLSPEAIARAGIEVAAVTAAAGDASIRVPGIVQANAYKQVVVSPLVGGRVTRVQAELGQRVRRGQLLASIYGPDAADAQAKLLAARAGLEAHDRALRRTEQLVGIGAASRQELERLHAEHAAKVAEVESARARLDVIGGTPGAEDDSPSRSASPSNTVDLRAPIEGTVVERGANAGLNVEVGMPIFTIADLSSVWVVGELYEQDFARVRLGTKALVSIPGLNCIDDFTSCFFYDLAFNICAGIAMFEQNNVKFGHGLDCRILRLEHEQKRKWCFYCSHPGAATHQNRVKEDAQDVWWKNSKAFQHFRPRIQKAEPKSQTPDSEYG